MIPSRTPSQVAAPYPRGLSSFGHPTDEMHELAFCQRATGMNPPYYQSSRSLRLRSRPPRTWPRPTRRSCPGSKCRDLGTDIRGGLHRRRWAKGRLRKQIAREMSTSSYNVRIITCRKAYFLCFFATNPVNSTDLYKIPLESQTLLHHRLLPASWQSVLMALLITIRRDLIT